MRSPLRARLARSARVLAGPHALAHSSPFGEPPSGVAPSGYDPPTDEGSEVAPVITTSDSESGSSVTGGGTLLRWRGGCAAMGTSKHVVGGGRRIVRGADRPGCPARSSP